MDYSLVKKRLPEVAVSKALEATKADFLATHVPFKNLSFKTEGLRIMDSDKLSEEDYFRDYILNTGDNHNFIIVKGDNGTGKSHFIRWLYYKYENEIDPNEEVALIISRGQNTLKSTLQQIINSEVFRDIEDTNEFQKLIEANDNLSEEVLREQIAALIVAECNVEEEGEGKYLKRREKRLLHSFLSDEVIREHILFEKDGPIERIMSKLIYNPQMEDKEIEAKFYPEDFKIEYGGEILRKMNMPSQRSADRAIRMAEMLANESSWPTLRADIAGYLNNKINRVIQASIKIGKNDLNEIFNLIRTRLKEHNKSLALFIEDITAFTGIDRELIEALLADHKEEAGQNLCRISSVVGVTTEYYNDLFPSNVRDRITNEVIISDESLFVSEEAKYELVARYLNAVKLSREDLDIWLANGAEDKLLPIAQSDLEHEWAEFQLEDGRKMSLYPFNKNAISNIYKGIKDVSPRNLIKTIMLNIFKDYINQPESFPATREELANIEFPRWENPLIEETLKKEIDVGKLGSLETLIKLWGEAHVDREIRDGKVYIGGLEEEVYRHFNLPLISGIAKDREGSSVPPMAGNTPTPVVDPGFKERSVEELDKLQNELDVWRSGGRLASHKWLREELCDLVENYFNWEEENISPLFMKYFTTINNFHIEGQTVTITDGFLMKRNDESYYVLLALGLWRFMGNRSWDFPGSEEYTLILINYLNKHREKILDTVRYPAIDNLEYWDYESWALLNEFYIRILNGELDFNYLLEDVYRKIFNTELNIDITRSYGEIWTSMRERLEKDRDIDTHHNQTIRYYNLILGETNPELTPVYFLDAYEILANLEELKRKDWTLDEQIGLFLEIQRGSTHYTPLNILKKYYVNRLDKLVEEGMAKLDLISGKLKDIFGQDYNEDNIDELNRMGKKFLEETLFSVNENYDPLLLATLTDSKNSGKAIMGFVGDMERIKELGNIHKLMKLSRLDVYDISLYLQVLTNLENKVGNVNNRFRSRLEGENIEEIDKIEETERNINKMIQDMKERILSEIEVSSHVGG